MTKTRKNDWDLIIESVCEQISNGVSLRTACIGFNISHQACLDAINKTELTKEKYAKARNSNAHFHAESILDKINEEPERCKETDKIDPAWVQLQRLKVDTLKWTASKMLPKTYGDKLDVTSNGKELQLAPIFLPKLGSDVTEGSDEH
jgi:predicted DNA-binding protein YlxM (UPF0122 family)